MQFWTTTSVLFFHFSIFLPTLKVLAVLQDVSCLGKTKFMVDSKSDLLQATTELSMLLNKECTNSTTKEDICTVSKRNTTDSKNITTSQVNITVDFTGKMLGRYVISYQEACKNSGGKLCDGIFQGTYRFHVHQGPAQFDRSNNLYYNTESYTWSLLPNNSSFFAAKNFPVCFDPGCQHDLDFKNYSTLIISEWLAQYFAQYYEYLDFKLSIANFTCY